jgi:hypothetical protein
MQTVLGFGPLRAGLAFLPQAAVIALTSNIGSRLASRSAARCRPRLLSRPRMPNRGPPAWPQPC